MKKNRRRGDAALNTKLDNFSIISSLLFHVHDWSNKINSLIREVIFMTAEQNTLIFASYIVCIYSFGINVQELEKRCNRQGKKKIVVIIY